MGPQWLEKKKTKRRVKKRATGKGSKTTTTTTTTPRRTDRARCTRTGRNGCGTERVRCTCREPVTIFVRPCVVNGYVLCFVFVRCVGWAARAERSATSRRRTRQQQQLWNRLRRANKWLSKSGWRWRQHFGDGWGDGRTDLPTNHRPPGHRSRLQPVQPLAPPPPVATCTCSQGRHGIIIISSADCGRRNSFVKYVKYKL